MMVDQKKLQMKWTDIEIRRHVMPGMEKEEERKASDDDGNNGSDDEEDLPPLLEKVEDKENMP